MVPPLLFEEIARRDGTHAYLFADERDDGDRNFMEHREVAQPQDRFEQQCQVKLGGWRLGVAADEFAVFGTGRIHVLKFALCQFRLKAWIRSFMNAAQDQASHMVEPPSLCLTAFRPSIGGAAVLLRSYAASPVRAL